MSKRPCYGFTLIEVLVTIVLVSVAIVGVMGGLRSIGAANTRAHTADLLQRLASEKMSDIKLLSDPSAGSDGGDFSDRGYGGITWAVTLEASGATNVDKITVTATRGRASQAITSLVFVRPTGGLTTAGQASGAFSP
jgi:prepilin-type N-terminal cleavage/methylation domain-containing protein